MSSSTNGTIAQHSNQNALHGIITIHMQIYKSGRSGSLHKRLAVCSWRNGAEVFRASLNKIRTETRDKIGGRRLRALPAGYKGEEKGE